MLGLLLSAYSRVVRVSSDFHIHFSRPRRAHFFLLLFLHTFVSGGSIATGVDARQAGSIPWILRVLWLRGGKVSGVFTQQMGAGHRLVLLNDMNET